MASHFIDVKAQLFQDIAVFCRTRGKVPENDFDWILIEINRPVVQRVLGAGILRRKPHMRFFLADQIDIVLQSADYGCTWRRNELCS